MNQSVEEMIMSSKLDSHVNEPILNTDSIIGKIDEELAGLPIHSVKIISRPLIKGVFKQYLHPHKDLLFLLSNSKKSPPPISSLNPDKNGLYSFFYIQELSLKWLKSMLTNLLPLNLSLSNWTYSVFEAHASVNLRRRQEDRFFFVPDPSDLMHPTMAFGVFDGHGGPEVAEHCTHLAPFLIGKYVQQMGKSEYIKCIPDVLTSVFRDMNESVLEGHKADIWKGGATCTICIIHDGHIYTAWIGDSQAWLVFEPSSCVEDSSSIPVSLPITGNSLSLCPGDHELLSQNFTNLEEDVDLNYDECMPLTDMLHRPSNTEEFVSVTRTGGLITYEGTLQRATMNGNLNDTSPAAFDRRLLAATLSVPNEEQLELGRVSGKCAVSRSFGDEYTLQGMSALPSMTMCCLELNEKRLLGVVVATDGLWDVPGCTGPTVSKICQGWSKDIGLAELLAKRAEVKKSVDNITVLFANLRVFNRHSPIRCSTPSEHQTIPNILPKKTLWPLCNRTASELHLACAQPGNIRGPNGYVDFGIKAKKKCQMLPQHRFRSVSCGFALEQHEAVAISSPMRVLELE